MAGAEQISTPCVGVCQLDSKTGLCLGCYRTQDEVQNWWDMTEDARKAVMAELEAREQAQFD